jgi:hypothetical protein
MRKRQCTTFDLSSRFCRPTSARQGSLADRTLEADGIRTGAGSANVVFEIATFTCSAQTAALGCRAESLLPSARWGGSLSPWSSEGRSPRHRASAKAAAVSASFARIDPLVPSQPWTLTSARERRWRVASSRLNTVVLNEPPSHRTPALRRAPQDQRRPPAARHLPRGRAPAAWQLVARAKSAGAAALHLAAVETRACRAPGCAGVLRKRTGRNGVFWACSRYPDCTVTEAASRPSRSLRRSVG